VLKIVMEPAGRCSFSELLLGASVAQSQNRSTCFSTFRTPSFYFLQKPLEMWPSLWSRAFLKISTY